ncbi:type II toxin-antitoxin system RelE/ParE family toxin [Sphingobium yanoikuyae]|uniref:Type II toxin-antitoxin system RelE/ParE family toxin n=1 Tax=Sphingobium yanoikuyae TaxID=13690 RepID=A0A6M4GAS5_SPHYA|nr:type II toxin-antitoxin system RelE/ParE family toxin [Sphingobium yanoikuyae]QJR02767.1 type II toxin-antitoxin system RelE/ParE family toxin [Sphingobium yanoikuyae]
MKILWTPEAHQDRADIWDYLFPRNAAAAARIDGLFSEAVAQLIDFPMLGHEGEVPGTRELTPHSSYRLVYEIYGDTIWILTVIHTKRQWPPLRG